jgi:hypothetical protein
MMEPEVMSWDNTQITIMVPSHLGPGTYELRVATKDGVTPALSFTVVKELPMSQEDDLKAVLAAIGDAVTTVAGEVDDLLNRLKNQPPGVDLTDEIALAQSVKDRLSAIPPAPPAA